LDASSKRWRGGTYKEVNVIKKERTRTDQEKPVENQKEKHTQSAGDENGILYIRNNDGDRNRYTIGEKEVESTRRKQPGKIMGKLICFGGGEETLCGDWAVRTKKKKWGR